MRNLAIFASGSGTNAENLIRYFSTHPEFRVAVVLCNKPDAFVLQRAGRLGVPSVVFDKSQLVCPDDVTEDGRPSVCAILRQYDAFALILAGFLMRIPSHLIEAWPDRIINIHPALLPKYGGKGMHGMHVHEAVVAAKEEESGITIHLVDEQYDHGKTLFQARCDVLPCDTAHDVAAKIHLLEQEYFPTVVDDYLSANFS
ncbi:MAG: phosphoribosylglycinamide formyltransferase [Bacteroidales bacterium]|nr:phosphoribosylglycinamide formyltransferase [Bacteroidales bacterium]